MADGDSFRSSWASLGYGTGSHGELSVTGSGSRYWHSLLYIGFEGTGSMHIAAGGYVLSTHTTISAAAGGSGEVVVSGSGSEWENESTISVGRLGRGSLTIENGGQVKSMAGYLGDQAGSTGEAAVTGTGSHWDILRDLRVGIQGDASLTVADGGVVTTRGLHASLSDLHGDGTIVASGGAVLDADLVFNAATGNQAALGFGDGGVLSVTADGWALGAGYRGNGTLAIAEGVAISSSYGVLGNYGGSSGDAVVAGSGSEWNMSETLWIGRQGTGLLTITEGGMASVGGTLTIDENGGDDSHVNLATGGMLALFGEADASIVAFLGLVNGTDSIRYWDDALGDWSLITNAVDGDDYSLEYLTEGELAGYTLLTVGEAPAGLAGDFNGDGVVDAADYVVWRDGLGATYSQPDYDLWRSNYGATTPVAEGATVPEPAAWLLLSLLAPGLRGRAGRR
ncbi:hypothetical protein [Posidoniimonas polymericola]|uniref:hypothetical protein n=1 Tax=Posidoniimonas polymericola TaxID=2528002 RepID=UPI0021BCE8A3|nr:hypothetical protein [Posidoniimonas polymericola]